MVPRGARVAVAVSGGKDSLALLKVQAELKGWSGAELVAVSVDEGVAGYRDEALAHAREVCRGLGVEHRTVSYRDLFGFSLDEAMGMRGDGSASSCSFCGVLRRRAIDEAAAAAGATVVATAHNLDDFVQTFLMNMLHGDVNRLGLLDPGADGRPGTLRRVKPFMEIYEEEIALFAYRSGLPLQSVSCPYMHEGLRSEVRDYLNEMEARHPGMKNVLFSSALDVISRYDRRKEAVPCSSCGAPCSGGLCGVCRMKAALGHHVNYTGN